MRRIEVFLRIAAASALVLGAATAPAQSGHDIIRGRIVTDSARPVAGATVRTLRAPDRAVKSAVTDAAGIYSIDWPNGSGDYLISVSAPGLPTVTRRLTRTGTDSVIAFDALLTNRPRVQTLPASVTQAARSAPTRNDDPEIGGTSSGVPWYRRMPPELNGDLAALAALLPGMMSTPAGNSMLGLAPNQNSVTMNGLGFAGGQVPRDARTAITVSASTYDPANGWFSGARTNVSVLPGGLLSHGTAHFTADAPSLQSTDPIASRLGQRYTNLNGSVGITGALLDDRLEYNFGLQGGRRSATVASLVSADGSLLQHAGVARDSASRLLQLLENANVPTAGGATSALSDNVVFLGRINQSRFDWATNKPVPRTWSVIAYGNFTRNQAQGIGPTSTPAHAGTTSQGIGSLAGDYSFYFNKDWLGDIRSGLTLAHNVSQPYTQLPDGRVLVTSTFGDGTAGTTPLSFGGNPGLRSDTRQWTWESTADLQFFPATLSRHRVKLNADSRLDGYSQDLAGNQLGTFSFNSLADLAANRPSSFTRTLNAPLRTGGEWNGYLALGDLWRPSQNVQLMYGGRIEASTFTSRPAYNPAVESTFGARTDVAPSALHFSPRFGFNINRPGKAGKPSGAIRGGVGELRNLIDPTLLAGPSVATGLPGGLSRLTCIGSAVPSPDWSSYESSVANIPSSCAGAPVASYADGAPNVQLIDPGYQPQRSWRANLAWTSTLWRRTVYTLEAIESLNLNQPGTVDLNFAGPPRFTTADEGRPVFANIGSVVSSTGVVSAVDARRSSTFGRVANSVSDLRSFTTQTRLTFRPDIGPLGLYLRDASVAYVFSNTRAQQRGFNAPTFGDPSQRAWSRGDFDVRHQFTVQTIFWPRGTKPGPGFFFYGHVQSGLPFTPIIATDVNGDGLANDRAFVFASSQTGDTAVANGIDRLRTSSSRIVSRCIARNLGRAAARSGCEGPWTATLNLNVILPGDFVSRSLDRFDFGINLSNPLGGLDELLHGSSHLKGWGAAPQPDPILYNVRGFDPAARRYQYTVNPRFGSTSPSINTIRAPFRLTLDVTMDVGRSLIDQQLDRWLRPGRGGRSTPKLTYDQMAQRVQRNVPDPYAELLQQADSLLLTTDQTKQLQAARGVYRMRVDSVWAGLAHYLVDLPDRYDFTEAAKHMDDVVGAVWEMTRLDVQEQYKRILAPEQLPVLSGWSKQLFDSKRPLHVRLFQEG